MSERITIRSLWITRKSIDGGFHFPEMVEAWDTFSIDENYDGWVAACKAALDSIGSDLAAHRYIDLNCDYDQIDATFHPAEVDAVVHVAPRASA